MIRLLRTGCISFGLIAAGIGSIAWLDARGDGSGAAKHMAFAEPGDAQATIRASGRLEPEDVIDVGSLTCGCIVAFGRDANGHPLDSGSPVEEGMVLARIDDRLAAGDVAQSEAALAQARSAVLRAKADLDQSRAKLPEAEARWTGVQHLQDSGAANCLEMIAYKSGYDVARSNIDVSQAAVAQAQNAVAQAEATLSQVRQKHSFCTIRSPVTGVVLERRVNIGQTLVSNMSAPSLFLIAKDLHHMKVAAPVSETQISRIHPGQQAAFTVDAFPGQSFEGTVRKIRLNANTSQQAATYIVEIAADNPEGKLLPYLTVNVQFLGDQI